MSGLTKKAVKKFREAGFGQSTILSMGNSSDDPDVAEAVADKVAEYKKSLKPAQISKIVREGSYPDVIRLVGDNIESFRKAGYNSNEIQSIAIYYPTIEDVQELLNDIEKGEKPELKKFPKQTGAGRS